MLRSTKFVAAPSTATSMGLFSTTLPLLLHSKKTARRPVRTAHTEMWYRKAKPNHLTAKTINEIRVKPGFDDFQQEVDKPYVMPHDANCFQCKAGIEPEGRDKESYVWIPSGNATYPTAAGYFFHTRCFRCNKCGFRFHHNKFYSTEDNHAICINCALGRAPEYPYRIWHGHNKLVSRGRLASKMSGHEFPRHQHQVDFMHDPES